MLEALGMIEVTGYLGAISAADAACKAANVQLLRSEKVQGGITTVELIGDVAAISAAVEAGKLAAEKLHCLRASHVIPRMDPSVQTLLLDQKNSEKKDKKIEQEIMETVAEQLNAEAAVENQEEIGSKKITEPNKKKTKKSKDKK